MPPPLSSSLTTRKRTRSSNVSEGNSDHQPTLAPIASARTMTTATTITTTTTTPLNTPARPTTNFPINAPPKRQRNNPPGPLAAPPVLPRTSYSLRNRSLTPDPRHSSARFPSLHAPVSRSTNRQRYNLRSRRPQSQVRLPQVVTPHPTATPRRIRRPVPSAAQTGSASSSVIPASSLPIAPVPAPPRPPSPALAPSSTLSRSYPMPPAIQPRQYRLVYISDDDDDTPLNAQANTTYLNTTFNLATDDEEDDLLRSQTLHSRPYRSISGPGLNARLRTTMNPTSATSTSSSSSSSSGSLTTINTQDFINGVAHVRLNRAIEIVIDSIQSLEGAVNNFDQLVFGLIYGRLGTRNEFESIEGMIRLSRILNLNLQTRLSQDEIDALPKIIFDNKPTSSSSILLAEKCPICLTEFNDQETINKLHCTHLFHLPCISTWLSENDSCPTCRRKVTID